MNEYRLSKQAVDDLKDLRKQYPNIEKRFLKLINEVCEREYKLPQTGKPEPLRGNLSGLWSKRLTNKDRIIYKVTKGLDDKGVICAFVDVISCKGHYNDT